MHLIIFFFLPIIIWKCVKSDIPVHCLSRHVEGLWKIEKGMLKSKHSTNRNNSRDNDLYDIECGYKRPDNYLYHGELDRDVIKDRFERKQQQYFLFNNDRTVQVFENEDTASYSYYGYWQIIYDEGLYIEIYKNNQQKETYFSFFKFQVHGDVSFSYCNELVIGIVNVFSIVDYNSDSGNNSNSDSENDSNDDSNSDSENDSYSDSENDSNNVSSRDNNKQVLNDYNKALEYMDFTSKKKIRDNNKPAIGIKQKLNKFFTGDEEPFYKRIDFFTDNLTNEKNLQIKRYCWYGTKLNYVEENFKTQKIPTNKIPKSIVSPILVDIEKHEKNYRYFEKEMELKKKESSVQSDVIQKIQESKVVKKKMKENSMSQLYMNKIIKLSNFDWTNESDVKERLGTYVKIVDGAIDQKNCGSCFADAASVIINARTRIKYNYIKNIDYLTFSKEQLLNCDNFNQGCSGGYIFLSLKYAYENFLQTAQCFAQYKKKNQVESNLYESICDRFDIFKKHIHQEELENNKHMKNDTKWLERKITSNRRRGRNQNDTYNPRGSKNNVIEDAKSHEFIEEDIDYIKENTSSNITMVNKNIYEKEKFDIQKLNSCDIQLKVSKYEYLNLENEEQLKNFIFHVGPVAVAIEPSKEFENYKKGILTSKFLKMQDGNKLRAFMWHKVDHAAVLVGWGENTIENVLNNNNNINSHILKARYLNDNKYSRQVKNSNLRLKRKIKYWKLLNSWGKKWGENGYFFLPRGINYYNIKSYPIICDINLFIKK